MQYHDIANEAPLYPAAAAGGLGKAERRRTDNYMYVSTGAGVAIADEEMYGGVEQRYLTLELIFKEARE
jgi:hypothetical protein